MRYTATVTQKFEVIVEAIDETDAEAAAITAAKFSTPVDSKVTHVKEA